MTYNEFIEKCKQKNPPKPNHYHHIIPKSVGGNDDESNRIYLSFSDHWLAHYILARENPDNKEYVNIFKNMGNWKCFVAKSYKLALRDRTGVNHPMFGKHWTEEQRKKNSESQKGKRVGCLNPMWGKHSNKGMKWKLVNGKRYYYREEE